MSFTRNPLLLFFLIGISSYSQEDFTAYLQPQIALSYSLTDTYSHTFLVNQRNYIYRNSEREFNSRHLDLAHFSNYKWAPGRDIGFGLMYRFRDTFEAGQPNELRLSQQIHFQTKPHHIWLGHRIRAEQRFFPGVTIFRMRYRFAMNGPLKGEELNIGEAYWTAGLEPLASYGQFIKPVYDIRGSAFVGVWLYQNTKLQGGVEYRFENFSRNTRQVLFLLTSINISL